MTYDYGRFVWFELLTSDIERASKFYAEVIGWTVQSMPMADGHEYPMIMASGGAVGGFAALPKPDASPHWVSYLSVGDVDAAAKTVERLGGRSLMEASDVPTVGRMQSMADPSGAAFFLFRNAKGDGESPTGAGSFHWNELSTEDPEAAVSFYQQAFGYTHETTEMPTGAYFVLKNGDAMRGGVTKALDESPAHWLQYVMVDDCDAAVARAERQGGKIMAPAQDVPGVGRFAILRDPLGATLGVIKP